MSRSSARPSRRHAATVPAPTPTVPPSQVDPLYRLELRATWALLRSQSPSFWLLCVYLFFEYVRIQEVYDSIKGIPFPSWTILLCAAAFMLEGGRLRPWTLGDTLLAVFSLVIVLSSLTAYSPDQSYSEFSLFFTWVLIYWLITSIVNTEKRFYLFMLLYLVYCLKMTQSGVRGWASSGFGFRSWGVTCAPSWFHNSGECGAQMSVLFPISLFFLLGLKPYWEKAKVWAFSAALPAASIATIIASSSRGAVLALAGIGLWMVLRSRQRVRSLLWAAVLAVVVVVALPEEQKDRFRNMGDDKNSVARLTYWKDGIEILQEHPVLGIGYRNWIPYYREYYNPDGELPHNIFIEAGSELGYIGLMAFAALIVGTFVMNHRTRRLAHQIPDPEGRFLGTIAYGFDGALIGFLFAGLFVTILYYPFFWINLSMTVSLYCVTLAKSREPTAMRTGPRTLRTGISVPRPARLGQLPRHAT